MDLEEGNSHAASLYICPVDERAHSTMRTRINARDMLCLKKKVFQAVSEGNEVALLNLLHGKDKHVIKKVLHHRWKHSGRSLTPLMIAAERGHIKIVRLLLENYRVEVDQTGTLCPIFAQKVTAFWCVFSGGPLHLGVCEELWASGANVNHRDAGGFRTPLLQACRGGQLEAVEYLVNHGADVNLGSAYGLTPLMMACSGPQRSGREEMVEFLLQHGADPNRQDDDKHSALHEAALHMRVEAMILLLNYGATLTKDSKGLKPPLSGILAGASTVEGSGEAIHRLICHPRVSRQDKVETLEVIGATACLDNVAKGFPYLVEAMRERFRDPTDILPKPACPPVACMLGNISESQTLEELEARSTEPHTLILECLLILDRACGEAVRYSIQWGRKVASALQNIATSNVVFSVWHVLMQKHPKSVCACLTKALDCVDAMLQRGETPHILQVEPLMELAMDTWKNAFDNTKTEPCGFLRYSEKLDACLRFCKTFLGCVGGPGDKARLTALVKRLVGVLSVKEGTSQKSLLHDAMSGFIKCLLSDEQSLFPVNVSLIQMLVRCNADIHTVNRWGQTPLAVLAGFPLTQHPLCQEAVQSAVDILVEAGAHLDCVDGNGCMPTEVADLHMRAVLSDYHPLSLKCLASQTILKHNVNYQGCLPEIVQKYVQLHEKKPA